MTALKNHHINMIHDALDIIHNMENGNVFSEIYRELVLEVTDSRQAIYMFGVIQGFAMANRDPVIVGRLDDILAKFLEDTGTGYMKPSVMH